MLHCSLHQGFVNQALHFLALKRWSLFPHPLTLSELWLPLHTLCGTEAVRGFFLLLLLLGSCPAIAIATQLAGWRQIWGPGPQPTQDMWMRPSWFCIQPAPHPVISADHRSKSTQLKSAKPGLEQQEPQETVLCRLVNAIYFQVLKFEQLVMGH